MMRCAIFLVLNYLVLIASHPLAAQQPVDSIEPRAVIAGVKQVLQQDYVYPDKAETVVQALENKRQAGRYSGSLSAEELADLLSQDLVEITGDFHFHLGYAPDAEVERDTAQIDVQTLQKNNFEFQRVEILPGNVGYLRLDYFAATDDVFELATSAMEFLGNSDALILDLRYNRGGHLETAKLIMSYLFPGDRDQELFDYFYNEDGKTIRRGQWVLAGLPGKRMPDIPIFVLTSTTTFSAGEWMAFSLSELERATVVGQRTAGAAHPVDLKRIDDNFVMQVPIGIVSGPVSGTDFEGLGVAPDHEVPSHRALEMAHKLALEKLVETNPAGDARWYLPLLDKAGVTQSEIERDIRDVQGVYEGRKVTIESGVPVYTWGDRFALALEPLGDSLFGVEGTDDYRFRLVRKNGKVTAMERLFKNGRSRVYRRIEE